MPGTRPGTGKGDAIDPATFQVLRARLSGVVQEMQFSLFRTGFSTIIRESQDASCALLDPAGKSSPSTSCCRCTSAPSRRARRGARRVRRRSRPGDAYLINHTYHGGSPHAPDFFIICPIFVEGTLLGFAASMAHKGDIGGPVPGSCSAAATEIYNEGLHLPAVTYQRDYETVRDTRTDHRRQQPDAQVVVGDMRGQLGSVRLGERRMAEIAEKHGVHELLAYFRELLSVSEERVRAAVRSLAGRVRVGRAVRRRRRHRPRPLLRSTSRSPRPATGSRSTSPVGRPDQRRRQHPSAAAACGLRVRRDRAARPAHLGQLRPARRDGRGHPQGQRRRPALPGRGQHLQPDRARGGRRGVRRDEPHRARPRSCGRLREPLVRDERRARARHARSTCSTSSSAAAPVPAPTMTVSGSSVNHTNGKIAPIEIVEREYPTRVLRCELIRDSAGAGRFRGGLGIRREYEVRAGPLLASLDPPQDRAARRRRRRRGHGRQAHDQPRHAEERSCPRATPTPAQGRRQVPAGDAGRRRLRLAAERDPERVLPTCARVSCRRKRRNATTAWCSSVMVEISWSMPRPRRPDAPR